MAAQAGLPPCVVDTEQDEDPVLRLLQDVLDRIDGWDNPHSRVDQAVIFEDVRRKAAAGLAWIGRAD